MNNHKTKSEEEQLIIELREELLELFEPLSESQINHIYRIVDDLLGYDKSNIAIVLADALEISGSRYD